MEDTPTQNDSTALQELIAFIEKDYEWFLTHSPDYGVVPKILGEAKSLLQKERKVIEDAYKAGFYEGCDQPMFDNMPSEYFTQTFKQ